MFHKQIAKIHNSGLSRTVIVCGNVYDLFHNEEKNEYLPLIPFIQEKSKGPMKLTYELNGPIRMKTEDKVKLKNAWISWKAGIDINTLLLTDLSKNKNDANKFATDFDKNFEDSIGNPTCALEFMRQIAIVSRTQLPKESIIFIVEAADMLLPNSSLDSLTDKQLHRISIVQDWVCDPAFVNGSDTLILVSESRGLIHSRIAKLPQVVSVEVPSPDFEMRKKMFYEYLPLKNISDEPELNEMAMLSAGLSLYAIRQLTKEPNENKKSSRELIIAKVEEHVQSQLGEDVVEFKKPSHLLNDCVGFSSLKKFLKEYLIPRFKATGDDALNGAGVCGSLGSGKTYIFEAVASELGMPVLVLKNIRSQWFGQSDVIFEKLKRTIEALGQVLIFIDEADLTFGNSSTSSHDTEKRLVGKLQMMMSDTKLKGKVFWLLMTARIFALPDDLKRQGRCDLIIPVLDPEGQDRLDFINWALKSINIGLIPAIEVEGLIKRIDNFLAKDYSSAGFSSLRSNLKYKKIFNSEEELFNEIKDLIPPQIGLTRRYQTLQALFNCTRRSLLPAGTTDKDMEDWQNEIRKLEAIGIK